MYLDIDGILSGGGEELRVGEIEEEILVRSFVRGVHSFAARASLLSCPRGTLHCQRKPRDRIRASAGVAHNRCNNHQFNNSFLLFG